MCGVLLGICEAKADSNVYFIKYNKILSYLIMSETFPRERINEQSNHKNTYSLCVACK